MESFSYLLLRPCVYRLQPPPSPSYLLPLCSILTPTSFTCVQSLLLLPSPVITPYSYLFLHLGHFLSTPTIVSPCSFLLLFPVINPYPLTEGTTTWPNPFLYIHNLHSYPLLLHMFNITPDRTPICIHSSFLFTSPYLLPTPTHSSCIYTQLVLTPPVSSPYLYSLLL